jgi:DNA-directed RNA polymerase subunit L
VRDVEILENTSQIPHEMIKHRVEMLPVMALPSDASIIRDAKIELRVLPSPEARIIRTNDFVVTKAPGTLLMGDRDTGAPLLFLKLGPNESVHIRAGLSVETKTASQVCVSTLQYHIDPVLAEEDKRAFLEDGGEAAVFNNFYIQKSYSRDEKGRPNWIDLNVESVGVIPAKDLVQMAARILKQRVAEYMEQALANITRHKDNEYSIALPKGGHTELAPLQEIMYSDKNVNFVSYSILHPLKADTLVRIHTEMNIETILKNAQSKLEEYCDKVEKDGGRS